MIKEITPYTLIIATLTAVARLYCTIHTMWLVSNPSYVVYNIYGWTDQIWANEQVRMSCTSS